MVEARRTRARAAQVAAIETPPPKPNPLKRKKDDLEITTGASTPVDDPEPVQESLPIKLVDGRPLPTLRQPQPADLPLGEYQSIIDSGVLNVSLKRSREVWLSGCHFKKYYTKPTMVKKLKERTQEDKDALARDKVLLKSLVKIGDANLTVDPHIFTVSVYTIKDPSPPAPRYTPQYVSTFAYQSPHTPSTPQYKPPVPQVPRPMPVPPLPKLAAPSTPVPTTGPRTPGTAPVSAAPDPVIHMLAQRAGTDPELKSVMKIVAAGQATPQQLEFFQGHINELTKILEAQKAAQAAQAVAAPPVDPPPSTPAPASAPKPAPPRPIPATPVAPPLVPISVPSAYTPQAHYNAYGTPQPHQHNSPYAPPPLKPLLRPVVFEFHENNSDKLYFPEHSILEFLPGGRQLRASFLVTKTQEQLNGAMKGSETPVATSKPTKAASKGKAAAVNDINSPAPESSKNQATDKKDEPKIVLYQPVTALVAANDPRVLEWFARAVHPPEVVEKYMNEVFDTAKPAEETYLALRLPRDADIGERTREGSAAPRTPVPEPERKKMVRRPRKVSLSQ